MIDFDKVERQAPHMIDLVKEVGISFEKHGLDANDYRAAVVATIDRSGSTESGGNRLYSDGTMQRVCDMAFAAALVFDDDGEMPVSLFSSDVTDLGAIELDNCKGFIDHASQGVHMGGTDYLGALRWIVTQAGHGSVDLGRTRKGLFSRLSTPRLEAKARAPYPTYALFVTDGEPDRGTEQAIVEYLTLMSQLPIFVQFVGVGQHDFRFLKHLDEMDGRFVDNANFFSSRTARTAEDMLERMLGEFPEYYAKARRLGLID